MIWFLSVEGIHFTTLKNIVTNTIGSIFVYPQEQVKCPRPITEDAYKVNIILVVQDNLKEKLQYMALFIMMIE